MGTGRQQGTCQSGDTEVEDASSSATGEGDRLGDVRKDIVERGEVRGALEQGCGGGDVVLEDVVVGTW